MIVMKFGGASLASPSSIRRVAYIVLSQRQRNPIIVVSAIGDTTDKLLKVLEHASRAESHLAWKIQEEVKVYHFCVAEDLLGPETLEPIDQYIRQTFRDLHVRMLEVCEGERSVTPELRDWVASLGEQLSSRIVAAVLKESGIEAVLMDSTKLILTDERFIHATPRYWETYARIRWSIPLAARNRVVVLGGFLGATEDGRTTTLGRGGSDLTASIVGAALNAEEIQVWKDVEGFLTWDPEIRSGGYRLRSLSYEEAAELAQAGASILHPDTIAPARRLRIPIIIRNTFRPDGEGTRIVTQNGACFNPVKSIACRSNVTLVELRSPTSERALKGYSSLIERVCHDAKVATLLGISDEVIYLALESGGRDPGLNVEGDPCVEVRIRTNQAIVTLVGHGLKKCNVAASISHLLIRQAALILPQEAECCSVRIAVAQEELAACADLLDQIFFAKLDPAFFALPVWMPEEQRTRSDSKASISQEQQLLARTNSRFALRRVLS
ncbi:MAG TPA: aspartate kinase [Bryobacteraceae bacterium]|jgi:aspartate kinase